MLLDTQQLLHDPADGGWNMAVDEALLESAGAGSGAWLRFYAWAEPTLSLGYFQPYAERDSHPASRDCAVVRRSSGGGAILHDREITYSLALPAAVAGTAEKLYLAVHRALLATLREFGVEAQICERAADLGTPAPFLCFQRRERGDVLLGSAKIAGSAQRRRRGGVLQHGSLLLESSPCAPELPGISELTGRSLDAAGIIRSWSAALARELPISLRSGGPPDGERIAQLQSKLTARDWLRRR